MGLKVWVVGTEDQCVDWPTGRQTVCVCVLATKMPQTQKQIESPGTRGQRQSIDLKMPSPTMQHAACERRNRQCFFVGTPSLVALQRSQQENHTHFSKVSADPSQKKRRTHVLISFWHPSKTTKPAAPSQTKTQKQTRATPPPPPRTRTRGLAAPGRRSSAPGPPPPCPRAGRRPRARRGRRARPGRLRAAARRAARGARVGATRAGPSCHWRIRPPGKNKLNKKSRGAIDSL